jgi:hypothetical protein
MTDKTERVVLDLNESIPAEVASIKRPDLPEWTIDLPVGQTWAYHLPGWTAALPTSLSGQLVRLPAPGNSDGVVVYLLANSPELYQALKAWMDMAETGNTNYRCDLQLHLGKYMHLTLESVRPHDLWCRHDQLVLILRVNMIRTRDGLVFWKAT